MWIVLAPAADDAAAPGPERGWWSPRLAWAAAAVMMTAAGAGYLTRPQSGPPVTLIGHATPAVADPGDDVPALDDDGWAFIAAVAGQAVADDAFAPQVGQAELSISALSADERRALASELAAERS